MAQPQKAETTSTTLHHLEVPGTSQKVSVELELVAPDDMPASLAASRNVAKLEVGGHEFFAVVGKTGADPWG